MADVEDFGAGAFGNVFNFFASGCKTSEDDDGHFTAWI